MSRRRHEWTGEMDRLLREHYPTSPTVALAAALPEVTRIAIYQRAAKLGLKRWNQGSAPVGKVAAGTATCAEIGWLAGFIDGEGTLQLARTGKHKASGNPLLTPRIVVVNTHEGATRKVHELLGGYVHENRPGLWAVTLVGVVQLQKILTVLIDHLTVKRPRAVLLLRFSEVRQAKAGRAPYDEAERALYEEFYRGSGRAGASRVPRQLNEYANPEPSSEETRQRV